MNEVYVTIVLYSMNSYHSSHAQILTFVHHIFTLYLLYTILYTYTVSITTYTFISLSYTYTILYTILTLYIYTYVILYTGDRRAPVSEAPRGHRDAGLAYHPARHREDTGRCMSVYSTFAFVYM